MRAEKLYEGKKNMTTVTSEFLTRKQVADLFQVSQLTVIRLERAGKLQAMRLGAGSVRYQRSAVEKLIQESVSKGSN